MTAVATRSVTGLALIGIAATLAGCEYSPPFRAVDITPIFGWADGCTPVRVSGSGYEDNVQVQIGGNDLLNLTLPDPATNPLDVGFLVDGITPPGPAAGGLADVTVRSGGETSTISDIWYYEACPAPVLLEAATEEVANGDTVSLIGCNISATYTVRVADGAGTAIPITSVCSSAEATFTAPTMADGTYYYGFFDGAGAQVWPDASCDISTVPGSWAPDTADTGEQFDPCDGAPTLTYGGTSG